MGLYSIKRIPVYYLFVIVIWLASVVSRVKFNGLVYNLDFGMFQPDGMYYSFKTLAFLGSSEKSAIAEITEWYKVNSFKFESIDLLSFNDLTSNPWLVTKFRIIYPLLSVPFVYLFGLSGMLVIPILSFLCFLILIQKLAIMCEAPKVGIVMVFLLSTSPTLLRWTTVNYSDALILALFSLLTYLVYSSRGIWTTRNLIALSILIVLATFTRQTLPIWICIGIYFLLSKRQIAGFVTILVSVVSSIPSIVSFPYKQFLNSKQGNSLMQGILEFLGNAFFVNLIEIAQLFVMDRILLILLIISFYCAYKFNDKNFTYLLISITVGCILINSLVGVAGINFRYMLAILPSVALVVLKSDLARSIEELLTKSKSKN
jgi:hypothetical protein